jgi:pyocin large subunit-like protein
MRLSGWLKGAVCLSLWLLLASCRQTGTPLAQPAVPANTSAAAVSAAAAIKSPNIGFASRQKWLDHFDKHGREFGNITAEEYLQQAQMLRDRAAGGDVLESVRRDGVITRFDKQAGAFLAFNENLTIRTYFKPNDGANYFWRQSKR